MFFIGMILQLITVGASTIFTYSYLEQFNMSYTLRCFIAGIVLYLTYFITYNLYVLLTNIKKGIKKDKDQKLLKYECGGSSNFIDCFDVLDCIDCRDCDNFNCGKLDCGGDLFDCSGIGDCGDCADCGSGLDCV